LLPPGGGTLLFNKHVFQSILAVDRVKTAFNYIRDTSGGALLAAC